MQGIHEKTKSIYNGITIDKSIMPTYTDTIKKAHEDGLLLDWSGNVPHYYDKGAFCDLSYITVSGMCTGGCGDWDDEEPTVNGTTYTTTALLRLYPDIDSLPPTIFNIDSGQTFESGNDYIIKFTLKPNSVPGLNDMEDAEFEKYRDMYAEAFLFATPQVLQEIEILDPLGIDVTSEFQRAAMLINNEVYYVYMRNEYETQINMYDPNSGEVGKDMVFEYTIRLQPAPEA